MNSPISNKDLVSILVQDSLIRTVKEYGLEGTFEAIYRCYGNNEKALTFFLEEYRQLYGV